MLATHDFLGCGFTATTSREVMAFYVDGLRNHLPEVSFLLTRAMKIVVCNAVK